MYSSGLGWWAQAVQGAQLAYQAYDAMSGGDEGYAGCWRFYNNRPFTEPCAGTPNMDAVIRAVEAAPATEISKLVGYLKSANNGQGPGSRGELANPQCAAFWVKAILGGKDCRASMYPEAPGWFQAFVIAYGAPVKPGDALPGSGIIAAAGTPMGGAVMVALALGAMFLIPALAGGKKRGR